MKMDLRVGALALGLLVMAGTASALTPNARDGMGQAVAEDLRFRYELKARDCGSDNEPAILCSGILMRGTVTNPKYHAWNPNPASTKGSVSFSWLRMDSQFHKMHERYTHGFVFLPPMQARRTHPIEVLCAFPKDAQTDRRDNLGCGAHDMYPQTSRICPEQNVHSAADYVAYFRPVPSYGYVCGFPVANGTPNAAKHFRDYMETVRALGRTTFHDWSEVLVREWAQDAHATLPIEAFFYQNDQGLDGARLDQADFHATSGRWVPIIRFEMPATVSDRARFSYTAEDQALR